MSIRVLILATTLAFGATASPALANKDRVAGSHLSVTASGSYRVDIRQTHFNRVNAEAVVRAAAELGTSAKDLATVISYETGGTFSPSKWGGKGGRYMGLIQFGPPERARYGAYPGQSFSDQMGAVVRYLKDRGFRPGMGLMDLYSTINAGRPGRYDASDGNGTVRSHTARMKDMHGPRADAFLRSIAP